MLQEIVARQKEEIKEILSGRIVPRNCAEKVERHVDKQITKVVTGIRRSGKSVLSHLLLSSKNYGYVNFDERELVNVNLDTLLSAIKEIYGDVSYLLLDEIQNVEGWELWVNSLMRRGYNLIITGSNAKLLSKELATHLTGRYLEFEVFPFSFKEFLLFKEFDLKNIQFLKEKQGLLKNLLTEYTKTGGFPELLVKNLDFEYLRILFSSIIFSDVAKRWNVKYVSKLEDLARYLISINSSEYSYTKLRKILDFKSTLTVENYVKYLEEAYLIFSVQRFSFKEKEIIKAPRKVYAVDPGMFNAISSRTSRDFGKIMENLVFLELRKKGLKENSNIFYFKANSNEVDFVIKEGLQIKQLIQVTYASGRDEIEKREVNALEKASNLVNCKDMLVITWDYEDKIKKDDNVIKFLPLWKWLLEF